MSSETSPHANYIFSDEEFEKESFDCAALVVAYQHVLPLENLKHELRSFLEAKKQQLYEVVNKDYKDFINVATKLEGTDVRISLIKAPMSTLRLDANAMYEALMSALFAIQSAVQARKSLNDRKQFLHLANSCLNKLETIERILHPPNSESLTVNNRRSNLLNTVTHGKRIDSKRDIFACSELERAACEVALVESTLGDFDLSLSRDDLSTEEQHKFRRLGGIKKDLLHKAKSVREKVLTRITERLTEMMHSGVTAAEDSRPEATTAGLFSQRSLVHLLRAAVHLDRGELCEGIVAEKVVIPMIRTHLIQGRVDGDGGRGSYSGIAAALDSLFKDIAFRLGNVIACCEREFCPAGWSMPVDVVVRGVCVVAMAQLESRCEDMFALAIADAFHACHAATELFLRRCTSLTGAAFSVSTYKRLRGHPAAIAFQSNWKLELYTQIRSQEIVTRVEAYCAALSCLPALSETFPADLEQTLVQSLDSTALLVLRGSLSFRLPIVHALVVEIAICMHDEVFIAALAGKLLQIAVRLLLRIEALVATVLKIGTPSFAIEKLKSLDTKGDSRPRYLPRDLIWLMDDLRTLSEWLLGPFCRGTEAKSLPEGFIGESSPIRTCLRLQAGKIQSTGSLVWEETCRLLASLCKDNVMGVKGVASKYRMTNKPPPTAPSQYVAAVFEPIRDFLSEHAALAPSPSSVWLPDLVVAVVEAYLQLVQALMETVRQMDSALQRRSKLRATTQPAAAASSTSAMSDSEKITLQLLIDARALHGEVARMDILHAEVPAFTALFEELADADRFLNSN